MDYLWHILKELLTTTLLQIWIVFGIFFILGLLLYFFSRTSRYLFVTSGYPKIDIFITGWIGTPVHELGHALFCVLFGHTIQDMKLFKPDKADGTLGYITHSYDKKNLYHTVGNFFIGCGPILLGSAMLFILFYLGFPLSHEIATVFNTYGNIYISYNTIIESLQQIVTLVWHMFSVILTKQHINSWQFWVIVYIAFSIASHMQLSPPDIKIMLKGFLVILGLLTVVNIVAVVWEFDINAWIVVHFKIGYIYGMLVFATSISAVFFIVSYICMAIVYGISKHKLLPLFG